MESYVEASLYARTCRRLLTNALLGSEGLTYYVFAVNFNAQFEAPREKKKRA